MPRPGGFGPPEAGILGNFTTAGIPLFGGIGRPLIGEASPHNATGNAAIN